MEDRLKDTGVDGYSYPSINEYLKGSVSPRLELLSHAAEVLEVRLAWLASGDGVMDRQAEEQRRQKRYGAPDALLFKAVAERQPWLRQLTIGVQQTFLDVLRALERQAPAGQFTTDPELEVEGLTEERLELADDLVFLLMLPFRSWGFPMPEILREEATVSMELSAPGTGIDVDSYFRQMLGALATALNTGAAENGFHERPSGTLASLRRACQEEAENLPRPTEEEQERAGRVQAALEARLKEAREQIDREGLPFDAPPVHPTDEATDPDDEDSDQED